MLRKVLKYDLDAIWLPWVIMSITSLVLSVASGFSLRALMMYDPMADVGQFPSWMPLAVLVLFATVIAIVLYGALSTIMVLVRYYQNFFTDEGYLTFTLPVKRSTLFNSKFLSAIMWNVGTTIVILTSLVIALSIAPANQDGTGVLLTGIFSQIFDILSLIFTFIDGWLWAHFAVIIVLLIIYSVFSTLLMFACVTIGCIMVKKLKVLVSILIYYFVSSAISIGSNILFWVYELITSLAYTEMHPMDYNISAAVSLFMFIAFGMMMVVICAATYNFILKKLDNNLNLA